MFAMIINNFRRIFSTTRSVDACYEALEGKRKGVRALFPFLGPAFIASIAYLDPGNYATNIAGGAQFGYKLLWVILFANLMGIVYQNLSAKLGIATNTSLASLTRKHFKKKYTLIMWGAAELSSFATDFAELLGATLAIHLIFHIPMILSVLIAAIATYLIVILGRYGFRPVEIFIGSFAFLIGICYITELTLARVSLPTMLTYSLTPWIGNRESILIAVGIIGATVMPHAIYLHSDLTGGRILPRNNEEKLRLQKFSRTETILAMLVAGTVNIAMMTMAAEVFYKTGNSHIGTIEQAYLTLTPLLGKGAAGIFLVSFLLSGISSSVVANMASQSVMKGFLGRSIPLWLRRTLMAIPVALIILYQLDLTRAMVISQAILCLVLPIPILLLIHFTKQVSIMGVLVNPKWINWLASMLAAVIIVLNIFLIILTFLG